MAKAQRYKERRRQELAQQQIRQSRHRTNQKWLVGLVLFALLAAFVLPRFLHDSLAKPLTTPIFNHKEAGMTAEKPVVTIETDKGAITLELYRDQAPKTVDHITGLIRKGFYNGLTFHRVVPGFVIQGGDPKGDGTGGSGQTIPFEQNKLKHDKGVLAMARSQDRNSADSQLYITLEAQHSLDGDYVVFGRVLSGMDVVERIVQGDKMNKITVQP